MKIIVGLFAFATALICLPLTIPLLTIMIGLLLLYVLWIIITADKITINMEEQHDEH